MARSTDSVRSARRALFQAALIAVPLCLMGAPESGAQSDDPAADLEQCTDIGGPNDENLPPKALAEKAKQYVDKGKELHARTIDLLSKARNEKDVVRMTCISEKFSSIKGMLYLAEKSSLQLDEAVAANEVSNVRREYAKIAGGVGRMCELYNQVTQCVGADGAYIGEPSVDFRDGGVGAPDPYFGDPSIFFDPNLGLVSNVGTSVGQDDPLSTTRPFPISGFEE